MARTVTSRDYVYDPFSILLHWVMAGLLVWQVFFPPEVEEIAISERAPLVTTHAGNGILIFALILIRVLWMRRRGASPAVENVPAWQHKIAVAVHHSFYAVIFLTPIFGFTSALFAPFEVAPYGLGPLNPEPMQPSLWFDLPSTIHKNGSRLLIGLLSVHTAAALHHHFIRKNDLLRRMIPFFPRSPGGASPA